MYTSSLSIVIEETKLSHYVQEGNSLKKPSRDVCEHLTSCDCSCSVQTVVWIAEITSGVFLSRYWDLLASCPALCHV